MRLLWEVVGKVKELGTYDGYRVIETLLMPFLCWLAKRDEDPCDDNASSVWIMEQWIPIFGTSAKGASVTLSGMRFTNFLELADHISQTRVWKPYHQWTLYRVHEDHHALKCYQIRCSNCGRQWW